MVNSENLACSHADPTMSISCKLSVICGDRSHGGVVNGLNLEPEPLLVKICEVILFVLKVTLARASEINDSMILMCDFMIKT